MLGSEKEGVLREPNVITNSDTKGGVLSLELCELWRACHTEVRFKKHNSARNVYIEQVLLAVSSCDLAFLVEAETSVVDFVFPLVVGDRRLFRERATNNVGVSLLGQLT